MNTKTVFTIPLEKVFWPLVIGTQTPAVFITAGIFKPEWWLHATVISGMTMLVFATWFYLAWAREHDRQDCSFPYNHDYVANLASGVAQSSAGLFLLACVLGFIITTSKVPAHINTNTAIAVALITMSLSYALYLYAAYVSVFGYRDAVTQFTKVIAKTLRGHRFETFTRPAEETTQHVVQAHSYFLWARRNQKARIVEWAVVKLYSPDENKSESTMYVICSDSYEPGTLLKLKELIGDVGALPGSLRAYDHGPSRIGFCWFLLDVLAIRAIPAP